VDLKHTRKLENIEETKQIALISTAVGIFGILGIIGRSFFLYKKIYGRVQCQRGIFQKVIFLFPQIVKHQHKEQQLQHPRRRGLHYWRYK
jgi:hypothetical protein